MPSRVTIMRLTAEHIDAGKRTSATTDAMAVPIPVTLVKYDAARSALAAATRVDDVKDVRNKAVALAAYARQVNDLDMERWVAEIKVRAERKAGELLRKMASNEGGRPTKTGVPASPVSTLKQMGIAKYQAVIWKQIATIPEKKFEEILATATKPVRTSTLMAEVPFPRAPRAPKAPKEPKPEVPSTFDPQVNYIRNLQYLLSSGASVAQMFQDGFSLTEFWNKMSGRESQEIKQGLLQVQQLVSTILEGAV
jgi:hypothetical protein